MDDFESLCPPTSREMCPRAGHARWTRFSPRTVALIGATERIGSVGHWSLRTSPAAHSAGPCSRSTRSGRTCSASRRTRSIAAVPDAVDLASSSRRRRRCPDLDRRVRRGRGPGGDRHLGRASRRAGPEGAALERRIARAGPARPDAADRAELPGRDEPVHGLNATFAGADGPAGQRRVPQPERRAVHGRSSTGAFAQRRLQRLRLDRLDARRRLGRPDRLPGRRPADPSASSSTWSRSAMRGRSSRRRARWR